MSASDKLRALEKERTTFALQRALLSVMPELLAVVEAAEYVARLPILDGVTAAESMRKTSRAALVALDEKLA